jgi:AcrR family transcriptional regulator
MNDSNTTPPGPTIDGRHLRRQRGRAAVLEGMLELVFEGTFFPTAKQIAERAGVSHMSLYRYFEGVDDLRDAVALEWFSRHPGVLEIDHLGVGELTGRIERLIAARLRLYETAEPFARMFRIRANEHEIARANLENLHRAYVDQIRTHFNDQLQGMDEQPRDQLIALVASMTSFEAWDILGRYHSMQHDQIAQSWTTALTALLNTT